MGDTEKVNVIKRIYDIYYKEDVGFYTIAAILNREDIPSPKGGRWTPTVIRSILTNELYAGTLHYNRFTSDKWSGKTSRVPLNDQVRVENAHEAIISRELFEAVQKRIKANTGKFKIGQHPNLLKNTPKFVLNGIMFCLECARKYISAWTTRKSNIRGEYIQAYYKDSSRRTLGKQGCPDSISLHKEEIEGLVHKRIKDRLSDKEVLNNVKLRVKEKLQKVNSDENTKARIKELNVELVEIKSKIKNLSAVFSTQGMSKHIIDELQGEFEKLIINKKTVEKNIVELEKSDVDSVDIEKTCEKIMENYDKTIERLDSTSFQVQRRLVREMLHSIAVIPSKKRIYLAFYNLSKDQARKVQIDDSLIPDPIYNKIGPVDLKEDFYLKNISPSEHMYQEGKPLICYRP
ncbi:MAG: hypothetical protein A3J83_04245 [Elusimicrobia bacterium RIFOXYA2_FULL_40_6]|nr:MAG: hypothetical protein A3J83_04245 [Elusimicrobia bacterium RIFOXYA2_FULL_40_6]